MLTHHGKEPACTLNALRVFGVTEAEELEAQLQALEVPVRPAAAASLTGVTMQLQQGRQQTNVPSQHAPRHASVPPFHQALHQASMPSKSSPCTDGTSQETVVDGSVPEGSAQDSPRVQPISGQQVASYPSDGSSQESLSIFSQHSVHVSRTGSQSQKQHDISESSSRALIPDALQQPHLPFPGDGTDSPRKGNRNGQYATSARATCSVTPFGQRKIASGTGTELKLMKRCSTLDALEDPASQSHSSHAESITGRNQGASHVAMERAAHRDSCEQGSNGCASRGNIRQVQGADCAGEKQDVLPEKGHRDLTARDTADHGDGRAWDATGLQSHGGVQRRGSSPGQHFSLQHNVAKSVEGEVVESQAARDSVVEPSDRGLDECYSTEDRELSVPCNTEAPPREAAACRGRSNMGIGKRAKGLHDCAISEEYSSNVGGKPGDPIMAECGNQNCSETDHVGHSAAGSLGTTDAGTEHLKPGDADWRAPSKSPAHASSIFTFPARKQGLGMKDGKVNNALSHKLMTNSRHMQTVNQKSEGQQGDQQTAPDLRRVGSSPDGDSREWIGQASNALHGGGLKRQSGDLQSQKMPNGEVLAMPAQGQALQENAAIREQRVALDAQKQSLGPVHPRKAPVSSLLKENGHSMDFGKKAAGMPATNAQESEQREQLGAVFEEAAPGRPPLPVEVVGSTQTVGTEKVQMGDFPGGKGGCSKVAGAEHNLDGSCVGTWSRQDKERPWHILNEAAPVLGAVQSSPDFSGGLVGNVADGEGVGYGSREGPPRLTRHPDDVHAVSTATLPQDASQTGHLLDQQGAEGVVADLPSGDEEVEGQIDVGRQEERVEKPPGRQVPGNPQSIRESVLVGARSYVEADFRNDGKDLAEERPGHGGHVGFDSDAAGYSAIVGDRDLPWSTALAVFHAGGLQWPPATSQPQSPACASDVRGCLQCSNLVLRDGTCVGVQMTEMQKISSNGQGAAVGCLMESSWATEAAALSAKPGMMAAKLLRITNELIASLQQSMFLARWLCNRFCMMSTVTLMDDLSSWQEHLIFVCV
jgi:hypothetical protein